MNYIVRRIALAVAQIVALSFVAFLLSSIVPGDVLSETRVDAQVHNESLNRLRVQMHLDQPWPARYADWIGDAIRWDWGTSLSYGMPVSQLLGPRLPRTLELVIPAWLFSWTLGLLVAALGLRLGMSKWLDAPAAALQMIPEVILASLTTWVLLIYGKFNTDSIWLPWIPITLGLAPAVFLHASGALAISQQSRFARLARVARVEPRTFWLRFLLPAAANPLISLLGPTLIAAFGSALVVEVITGWPGIGALFLDAFKNRDYPVTQAILLLLGASLTITNLFADLVLYKLDPRIRE